MSQSEVSEPVEEHSQTFISDQDLLYITIALTVISLSFLSLCGLIANVFNILVFVGQSLKDNVSVALLSLSFTDFGVTLSTLGLSLCYGWKVADPNSHIDQLAFLYIVFAFPSVMLGNISAGTTVLVTFERCLCVVLPLKIKGIITPKRMMFAIGCMDALIIAVYLPMFATTGFMWVVETNNSTNRYLLRLWFSDNRVIIEDIYDYMITTTFVCLCEVCVISFSVIMVTGLKKAGRFRKSAQTQTNNTTGPELKVSEGKEQLSPKEARLAKTVLVVAHIFVACNTVLMATGFAHILVPEYDIGAEYNNLYVTCSSVLSIATTFNSSVNIVVYYKTSSKYRERLQHILRCCLRFS